jgi:hypothetical protein
MRESSFELDIHVWSSIMEGFCRAEGEDDQKKALSIWKYLSGQISHEKLGIDLRLKATCVSPSVVTLSIALDACKLMGSGCTVKKMKELFLFECLDVVR